MRAYYRVCSLLQLPSQAWDDRFRTYTFRQLHRTREMALLPFAIGEEDPKDDPEVGARLLDVVINERRQQLLQKMSAFASVERERLYPRGTGPCAFLNLSSRRNGPGGWMGFITLFDHFVPDFRDIIMEGLQPGNTPREYSQYIREEIWGDSSDEEAYRPKKLPRRQR